MLLGTARRRKSYSAGVHTHARTHTHTRTRTHAHARARTHARTHTHTHTHTHSYHVTWKKLLHIPASHPIHTPVLLNPSSSHSWHACGRREEERRRRRGEKKEWRRRREGHCYTYYTSTYSPLLPTLLQPVFLA